MLTGHENSPKLEQPSPVLPIPSHKGVIQGGPSLYSIYKSFQHVFVPVTNIGLPSLTLPSPSASVEMLEVSFHPRPFTIHGPGAHLAIRSERGAALWGIDQRVVAGLCCAGHGTAHMKSCCRLHSGGDSCGLTQNPGAQGRSVTAVITQHPLEHSLGMWVMRREWLPGMAGALDRHSGEHGPTVQGPGSFQCLTSCWLLRERERMTAVSEGGCEDEVSCI